MQKRNLGNSGIAIAPLSFGGNVFGWTLDKKQSFALLDAFVAAGFNFIDTADTYSRWVEGNKGGESETIIGEWMKQRGNRNQVIVGTKVGGDVGQGKKDLSRNHILTAVENSLQRLQTDYIDLYQSHYDDPETPVEETLETYAQLIKEGKIRMIGASNLSADRLNQYLDASKQSGYPAYQTLQPLYNLYDRKDFEEELQSVCVEKAISVISYYSLASGFLSGKYRSEADLAKSPRGGGIQKYLNDRGYGILAALDEVAAQYDTTPASIAIAWLLARPAIAAPIASATSVPQLEALVQATQLTLDAGAMDLLNNASAW